jgi:hypothetical protein
MKAILFALFVFCAWASPLQQNSYFPVANGKGTEGLTAFESEWYGNSLARMNEPSLPEVGESPTAEIYRLEILPTWGNPIAVRAEKQDEFYHLAARRLSGQGGYDPGVLIESKDVDLDSEDSKALNTLIQNLNFFEMPIKDKVRGFDGDEWVLEGVSHGKYHVVTRWCASKYNPDERGLKAFLALCKFLIDKSTLSEPPTNKGHKLN